MYPGWTPTHQFRAWYAHHLATLTFNSRPIIDKLSMAALERKSQGDWEGMGVVGEVIRQGIEAAPPTQKLPLFYLIDSIAKNAGQPYTTHILPPFLAQVYLSSYAQVDGLTRKKMEDMLTTWRMTPGQGTPEGELFPRESVRSVIEFGIYGRQMPPAQAMYSAPPMYNIPAPPSVHLPPASPFVVPTPPPQTYAQPSAPTRDTVTTALLNTLSAKRGLLAKNPHDTGTRGTVHILEQLQAHLMAGNVSPQELGAIQAQLDGLRAPSVEPPISMPRPMQLPLGLPGFGVPQTAGPATQSPRLGAQGLVVPEANSVAPPPPPATLDFSSLLGNLARAGILSTTGTPVPTTHADAPTAAIKEEAKPAEDTVEEADGMKEYEELVLGMNVQLTLADLSQTRDFQPTSHLPHRCSQCAARFAAGKTGKEQLQQHLDWHFRRNRKEREGDVRGRGANRRWLPRAEAWVNDTTEAFTGVRDEHVDGAHGSGSLAGMAPRPSATAAAQQRANDELAKKWVVVPAEEKAGGGKRRCPICKEEFVDEFVQDEEEWVWRNCVKVRNNYYHATCRADALATAAANRKATAANAASSDHQTTLREASPSGTTSREGTPAPAVNLPVKQELAQSPLKKIVKLEVNTVGADQSVEVGDPVKSVTGEGHDHTDAIDSSSLKRKAEGSPEAEKDVKKEKSE